MPTFGYVSDLHLSFFPRNRLPLLKWHESVDTILLAGDIMDGVKPYAIDHVLEMTQGIPSFMTLGNHELYGIRRDKAIRELKKGFLGTHVTLLLNESVVIEGVRLAATDLWTDFNLKGNRGLAMRDAEQKMNDYSKIRVKVPGNGGSRYPKLKPVDTLKWHEEARHFIGKTLTDSAEPVVLMTHHAMSPLSIPEDYSGHPVSPCYASDMDEFLGSLPSVPLANVHGHVHKAQDYRMPCGTRVLANPGGYYGIESETGFDPGRYFSVDSSGRIAVGG